MIPEYILNAKTDLADRDVLAEVLTTLHESQKKLFAQIQLQEDRLIENDRKIKEMFAAFPKGDFEGHNRCHVILSEMLEEKRHLRQMIKEKTLAGLVWAAVVGLGMAVWHEVLNILKNN